MLKMYHNGGQAGGSHVFWEQLWDEADFEEALRFCAADPLRPLFDHYLRRDSLMLEGGCGSGQYVAYYSERGIRTVGLDFATDTLTRLHAKRKNLVLCAGDVANLPFSSQSFDLYYSGGVVEHFEDGAQAAIREARRVLRPNGILLISVPYFSPMRRFLSPFRTGNWKRVRREGRETVENKNRTFWQYAYTRREFENMLRQAQLEIISTQGYAILWGLHDLPYAEAVFKRLRSRPKDGVQTVNAEKSDGAENLPVQKSAVPASLLKRLVVSEDATVPLGGQVVRVLRWACANMMMYVCEAK